MTEKNNREATVQIHGDVVKLVGRTVIPDMPNANGYVYPRDVVDRAMADLSESMKKHPRTIPCITDRGSFSKAAEWAGVVSNSYQDESGSIVVEIDLLDTAYGKLIKDMVRARDPYQSNPVVPFCIIPNAVGTPDKNGVLRDVSIRSFSVVPAGDLLSNPMSAMTLQDVLTDERFLARETWARPVSWRGAGMALCSQDGDRLLLVPDKRGGGIWSSAKVSELIGEWELVDPDSVNRECV